MRGHSQIIVTAGGATALAEALHGRSGYERWETVKDLANTIQGWKRSDSIPPEYWSDLTELGLATLPELAEHARRLRLLRQPSSSLPELPAA